jgi:hypothetical protein
MESLKIITKHGADGSGNGGYSTKTGVEKIIFRNSSVIFIFAPVLIILLSRKAEGNGPLKP